MTELTIKNLAKFLETLKAIGYEQAEIQIILGCVLLSNSDAPRTLKEV